MNNIYQDIAERTDGNVYIGVVGPVRSGKSTFIARFMNILVLPFIDSEYRRERATDELPQSAAGRTIMTTEPKFVPEEAASVTLADNAKVNIKLIDCVGFITPSSIGYIENGKARMVKTPWFESEVPFNMAAEVGTQKVITEHSTIGIVVTTDGSISEIPRAEYEEAEERVIKELNAINKPYVIVLNCREPGSEQSLTAAAELTAKYRRPVLPMSVADLSEEKIKELLSQVLLQFPSREIKIRIPKWLASLHKENWLKSEVWNALKESARNIKCIGEVSSASCKLSECEYVDSCDTQSIDLGRGSAVIDVRLKSELFYKILGEATGLELKDEGDLLPCIAELSDIRRKYDKIKSALDSVHATGYGIVMPTLDELTLEEPEIVRQGGRYGVRLRAAAPSIHMMSANITTEVSPIVGSERQSEELVEYLLREFKDNPTKIWESNIFGKSLHELVNEGLRNKLYRMPESARGRIQETIERIINDGCSGLICIIL